LTKDLNIISEGIPFSYIDLNSKPIDESEPRIRKCILSKLKRALIRLKKLKSSLVRLNSHR
jgi:hypothetical protein